MKDIVCITIISLTRYTPYVYYDNNISLALHYHLCALNQLQKFHKYSPSNVVSSSHLSGAIQAAVLVAIAQRKKIVLCAV